VSNRPGKIIVRKKNLGVVVGSRYANEDAKDDPGLVMSTAPGGKKTAPPAAVF